MCKFLREITERHIDCHFLARKLEQAGNFNT